MIKRFAEFILEKKSSQSLWRNTDIRWLKELVTKKHIEAGKGRFISLSLAEDSGGMDDFGDTCIEFNYDMVFEQGAQEVGYDAEFMESHPDICLYVTGYRGCDDYESQHDEDDISWETCLEDYSEEEEVVIKKLTYRPGLIKSVYFTEGNPDVRFLEGTGIEVRDVVTAETVSEKKETVKRRDAKGLPAFLKGKAFENPKSKMYMYHGTDESPAEFNLSDDYDDSKGHGWGADLPEGYLFLTTSIEEAAAYGQYVIPCELEKYDHLGYEVNTDAPSIVFDDDYGISTVTQPGYKHFGFWEKYEKSGKASLVIKGRHGKWTVITPVENVIARTDLAKEYYKINKA